MEMISFIIILAFFSMPLILGLLVLQTFIVLNNSDDYITSQHSQEFELELTLLKKIKREETNPLSIAALASPATLPMFFAWPKDEQFAVQFENDITIAVKEKDFEDLQVDQKYRIKKTITRYFYSRKWYEKPILINLMLNKDDKMKNEYEETRTKHRIIG
jgi:hypothetical protein